MSETTVRLGAAGELLLGGVLDFRSGAVLRKQGQALIKAGDAKALVLDCSSVEKSSSVGLSLLLCFLRDGMAAGKAVTIRNMPQDMRQIAEVCEMTELLAQT
jgi:phospholipid transport system transporter-binding protein